MGPVQKNQTTSRLTTTSKGDHNNINSSVDTRYPYLDPNIADFTAKLHEDYKLNG